MADHTISLTDQQEATLRYAARQTGKSVQALLEETVQRLLSEASTDLNRRVDQAVAGLVLTQQQQAGTRDRILRAIVGETELPDPNSAPPASP